jgi:hypothetical protein
VFLGMPLGSAWGAAHPSGVPGPGREARAGGTVAACSFAEAVLIPWRGEAPAEGLSSAAAASWVAWAAPVLDGSTRCGTGGPRRGGSMRLCSTAPCCRDVELGCSAARDMPEAHSADSASAAVPGGLWRLLCWKREFDRPAPSGSWAPVLVPEEHRGTPGLAARTGEAETGDSGQS